MKDDVFHLKNTCLWEGIILWDFLIIIGAKSCLKKGFEFQKQDKHKKALECFDKASQLNLDGFDAWY